MQDFAAKFWGAERNVWNSAPLISFAEGIGKDPRWIRRQERRLAAAGELSDRAQHVNLQVSRVLEKYEGIAVVAHRI